MKSLALSVLAIPAFATAVEYEATGFGTVGYAQSDKSYEYQRFIDHHGTFQRDSILGAQLDITLDQAWGAAIQGKVAVSEKHDSHWVGTLSWYFVYWRPADTWLLRLGKLRVPAMLNTENQDVGATYDFARLPAEVYSMVPNTDFTGLSIGRSWFAEDFEITLEGYTGETTTYPRYYARVIRQDKWRPDAFISEPGAFFHTVDITSSGVVLTARDMENMLRLGFHEAQGRRSEGFPTSFPFVQIAPGVGYYDMRLSRIVDEIDISVQTVGGRVAIPGQVYLTAEYARMRLNSSSKGMNRWGAYAALSRQFGRWTPYIYYAKTKSTASALRLHEAIDSTVTLSPELNAWQKLQADIHLAYDQWTSSIGTSYRFRPNEVVKAEWSQTRTGTASSFIDASHGEGSAHQRINVFSVSYNFSF